MPIMSTPGKLHREEYIFIAATYLATMKNQCSSIIENGTIYKSSSQCITFESQLESKSTSDYFIVKRYIHVSLYIPDTFYRSSELNKENINLNKMFQTLIQLYLDNKFITSIHYYVLIQAFNQAFCFHYRNQFKISAYNKLSNTAFPKLNKYVYSGFGTGQKPFSLLEILV